MNKVIITALLSAAVSASAAAAGAAYYHSVTATTLTAVIPDPSPPTVNVEIDEARLADHIVSGLVAAQEAKQAAEIASERKKNCAFWGPGFAPGC